MAEAQNYTSNQTGFVLGAPESLESGSASFQPGIVVGSEPGSAGVPPAPNDAESSTSNDQGILFFEPPVPPQAIAMKGPGAVIPDVIDIAAGRGTRVLDSRHAEKLRSGKQSSGLELPLSENRKRAEKQDAFSKAIEQIATIGIFRMTVLAAFAVLLAVLIQECFLAISSRDNLLAGTKAFNDNNTIIALKKFGAVIAATPSNSDAYYYRALSQMQNLPPSSTAEPATGSGAKAGSDSPETSAMNDLNKAIELDRKNLKAFMARAALSIRMQRWDTVVNDCSAALALDPGYSEAYRVRAAAYNHQFLFSKAIADSNEFLNQYKTIDSIRADALSKRAFAFDRTQNYSAAIQDYTDAIACDSNNAALYVGRAIVYAHKHDWQKGIDDCDAAIASRPSDPVIYKVRARCHEGLGMHGAVLADLDKLVELYPNADTHKMRGDRRFAEHKYLGALEDFEFVLAEDPADSRTARKYQSAKRILQRSANRKFKIAEQPAESVLAEALNLAEPELLKKGHQLFLGRKRMLY